MPIKINVISLKDYYDWIKSSVKIEELKSTKKK
jgi:hypothetical protein